VSGATDAAKAAADLVLTAPGLSVIITAVYESRKIFQRLKNYIIYRIACTTQLLLFFFAMMVAVNPTTFECSGHEDCDSLPNTFALPVIALVMITLLNDGNIVSIAYDNTTVARLPEKWNLTVYCVVSVVLGSVAVIFLHPASPGTGAYECSQPLQLLQSLRHPHVFLRPVTHSAVVQSVHFRLPYTMGLPHSLASLVNCSSPPSSLQW